MIKINTLPATKPAHTKRKIESFLEDIDRFMDFCLVRYIVWRETRGRKGR